MKRTNSFRFWAILFLALVALQACQQDDIINDFTNPNDSETEIDGNTSDDSQPDANDGNDNDSSDNPDNTNDNTDSDGGEGEITVYSVDGENITKIRDYNVSGTSLDFQKDVATHQEIWDLTKKIVPLAHRSKMSRFMIYSGEVSGSAGYVYQTKDDLSEWEMGIAIDYAYEGGFNAGGELAHTIIHEFGHILTLSKTQVDAAISENNCSNYFTGEGCAKPEAYINKLYTRYWADIASEHSQIGKDQSAGEAFYQKYQDRFVSDYAATNPGEDIAEVYAAFVIRNGGPNGGSIAEQKIQLMYDHQELVALRDYAKSNTAAKSRAFLPVSGMMKRAKAFGANKRVGCVRKPR